MVRLDPLAAMASMARVPVVAGALSMIRLPADQLRAWQPRTLADALTTHVAATLYDDLGSALKTTVVYRGFSASPVVGLPQGLSVFLDGIPLNEPDARQVNFDLLPLRHVRDVEFASGSASPLGPNTIGGAVNLVTQQGGGPLHGDVEIGVGSAGMYSIAASAGGSAGRWNYHAGASHDEEDGWRDVTGATRTGAFASAATTVHGTALRLHGHAARSRAETAGSLPESVFTRNPRVNLTAGDFEDLSQVHVALSAARHRQTGVASASIFARLHDAERFNVNHATDPDVRSFSRNRTAGATADWNSTRTAGAAQLTLRAAALASTSSTSAAARFHDRVSAGAAVRHVGRRWLRGDEANEDAPLESHTVLDAHLEGRWKAWQAGVAITNVLDTRYAAYGTFNFHQAAGGAVERFLTPGQPRTLRLTLQRRIGP